MADIAPPVVQPAPGVTPPQEAPAVEAQEPQAAPASLPPELLKLPVIQALTAGSPGAVEAQISLFKSRPDAKIIAANKDSLLEAGFGFYRSLDGKTGVIFNQLYAHPEDIKALDVAGKLHSLPNFDQIDHAISKAGLNHPALQSRPVPSGPAPRMSIVPPQSAQGLGAPPPAPSGPPAPVMAASGPPLSAGAQQAALRAKIAGISPGAPTSGPSPGAGRLMNSILRPAV